MSENHQPDHDPDTCNGSCGLLHDCVRALIREVSGQPVPEDVSEVVSMVTAMRLGDREVQVELLAGMLSLSRIDVEWALEAGASEASEPDSTSTRRYYRLITAYLAACRMLSGLARANEIPAGNLVKIGQLLEATRNGS